MALKPKQPTTPESRRATLLQNIESITLSLGEAALAADRNPTPAALELVASLEAELAGARRAVETHDLALQAAARQATAAEIDTTRQQVAELRGQVVKLSGKIEHLLGAIVDRIEGVGPDLAMLVSLVSERRQAAAAAARLASPPGDPLRVALPDGHDTIIAALTDAVLASGIGRTGPSLAPYVIVTAPGPGLRIGDHKRMAQRDHQTMLEQIDKHSKAPA